MRVWDVWARNYEQLWVQDWVLTPSRLLIREYVRCVCPDARRVLDVGCGTGQLARELASDRPGRAITAVDPSPGMIGKARMNTDRAATITYVCGTIDDIHEGGFDLVVSTNALPYMPDPSAALRTMRALLKPGGRALVIHANTNCLYDRVVLTLVKATVGRARYLPTWSLVDLLTQAGFRPGVVRRIVTNRWVPSVHMAEGLV